MRQGFKWAAHRTSPELKKVMRYIFNMFDMFDIFGRRDSQVVWVGGVAKGHSQTWALNFSYGVLLGLMQLE